MAGTVRVGAGQASIGFDLFDLGAARLKGGHNTDTYRSDLQRVHCPGVGGEEARILRVGRLDQGSGLLLDRAASLLPLGAFLSALLDGVTFSSAFLGGGGGVVRHVGRGSERTEW